ncbi:hypothetical protein E3N88_22298 [Mikania micrantha]|uniref:Retrovirus-related Pol polyprotein from transposon TNT 1-94-like beta-barrel domain-containing protein n=1 Tax=Mikania micrantha TaxID=192012 RepID=A0A5N6NBN7_9ASTR|nr:hypothetical protein E3N88_22298 [Mikania micrantha]
MAGNGIEKPFKSDCSRKTVNYSAAFKSSLPTPCEEYEIQNRNQSAGRSTFNNKNDHCTVCGRYGHKKEGCFKVIGYPQWWPGKVKKENIKPRIDFEDIAPCPILGLSGEQYQTFLKLMTHGEDMDEEWVVDSGASKHITYQRILLDNLKTNKFEAPVIIPNGEAIHVKGKGDLRLNERLNVKGVLLVPEFKCNLLSVRKLTKDLDCAITFFPDFFVMHGLRTGNLIGTGNCSRGLYRMGGIKKERKAMTVTVDEWHKRLGHASGTKLSRVDFL